MTFSLEILKVDTRSKKQDITIQLILYFIIVLELFQWQNSNFIMAIFECLGIVILTVP